MSETNVVSPTTAGSEVKRVVMGPPRPGPVVRFQAEGMLLNIRLNEQGDIDILNAFVKRGEQKRYGKAV